MRKKFVLKNEKIMLVVVGPKTKKEKEDRKEGRITGCWPTNEEK